MRRQTSELLGQRAAPQLPLRRGHVLESLVQLLADGFVLELLSI